jgi:hypothetical protein
MYRMYTSRLEDYENSRTRQNHDDECNGRKMFFFHRLTLHNKYFSSSIQTTDHTVKKIQQQKQKKKTTLGFLTAKQ